MMKPWCENYAVILGSDPQGSCTSDARVAEGQEAASFSVDAETAARLLDELPPDVSVEEMIVADDLNEVLTEIVDGTVRKAALSFPTVSLHRTALPGRLDKCTVAGIGGEVYGHLSSYVPQQPRTAHDMACSSCSANSVKAEDAVGQSRKLASPSAGQGSQDSLHHNSPTTVLNDGASMEAARTCSPTNSAVLRSENSNQEHQRPKFTSTPGYPAAWGGDSEWAPGSQPQQHSQEQTKALNTCSSMEEVQVEGADRDEGLLQVGRYVLALLYMVHTQRCSLASHPQPPSKEEASAELVVQGEPERDPNCERSAANQKAAHVISPPASTADASVAPLIYKNSASQATTQTTCAMQQSNLMPEQPSQQLVSQHPPQVTPVHNPPASRHVDAPTAAPTQVNLDEADLAHALKECLETSLQAPYMQWVNIPTPVATHSIQTTKKNFLKEARAWQRSQQAPNSILEEEEEAKERVDERQGDGPLERLVKPACAAQPTASNITHIFPGEPAASESLDLLRGSCRASQDKASSFPSTSTGGPCGSSGRKTEHKPDEVDGQPHQREAGGGRADKQAAGSQHNAARAGGESTRSAETAKHATANAAKPKGSEDPPDLCLPMLSKNGKRIGAPLLQLSPKKRALYDERNRKQRMRRHELSARAAALANVECQQGVNGRCNSRGSAPKQKTAGAGSALKQGKTLVHGTRDQVVRRSTRSHVDDTETTTEKQGKRRIVK
eukprot:CAMPEP_0114237166 /NCGR_PEP_ID=MMETSP0058-20121206/7238_1 /TAXON_ID=36894 /ORGANISM="Pyramimonas parkeae, CCMP726" /LENGTH=726 /DNA_ID=CAMNT_0001349175 /DNA_START=134 /DNA_END=2314 /DNA_ORIENTATION=-